VKVIFKRFFNLILIDGLNLYLKTSNDTSEITTDSQSEMEKDFIKLKQLIDFSNKNKNLSYEELDQLSLDLFKIKNSVYLKNESFTQNINEDKNFPNRLSKIMEDYYNNKSEYSRFINDRNKLENRAKRLTTFVIYFGGIFFIVELFLVYYLTFVVYAWDITEPMTFLLGCFNLLLVFWLKKKFNGLSAFEYFRNLFLRMILKRSKKIDLAKMEKLRKSIKDIEKLMLR
jgi:hypothetical protein